jgi:hypothetical protein
MLMTARYHRTPRAARGVSAESLDSLSFDNPSEIEFKIFGARLARARTGE